MSKLKHEIRGGPPPRPAWGPPPLVVLELEVEAAAGLEGVEVEGPALLSPASALLVLWIQGILARIELLPHFWRDNGKRGRDTFNARNRIKRMDR